MISIPVIAIFDIGKTNKKFFLIDEEYAIVLERSVPFAEIRDEDGDACDDVEQMTEWVSHTLAEVMQLKKFDVRAVNFSAYGASLVYTGRDGKPVAPLYSYLKAYPEALKNEVYEKYGGAEKISCETASPVLGSLNSGMQLYRIKKEQPACYSALQYALHLPQYISYIITQIPVSDITSIGCHTQLWNYAENNYHDWVRQEGLDVKMAPLEPSNSSRPISYNGKKLEVGTGLHDSSAALIPYLAVFKEPFVLISTGTWCISFNPFNHLPLTDEELAKDCLCYMEYTGTPVKASRLFAGHEHEQQVKLLAVRFNKPVDHYKKIKYNAPMVAAVKRKFWFNPVEQKAIAAYSSVFSSRDISLFRNYEQAYHCLMMDIMQQQVAATQLVITGTDVKRIFVDGGFSNNTIYMHLLALAFPGMEVYAASVAQATAMGAALAIHASWNVQAVPADMVKLKYYKITEVPGLVHNK